MHRSLSAATLAVLVATGPAAARAESPVLALKHVRAPVVAYSLNREGTPDFMVTIRLDGALPGVLQTRQAQGVLRIDGAEPDRLAHRKGTSGYCYVQTIFLEDTDLPPTLRHPRAGQQVRLTVDVHGVSVVARRVRLVRASTDNDSRYARRLGCRGRGVR